MISERIVKYRSCDVCHEVIMTGDKYHLMVICFDPEMFDPGSNMTIARLCHSSDVCERCYGRVGQVIQFLYPIFTGSLYSEARTKVENGVFE